MIKEFRFKGLTPQGRLIQGTVLGQSKRDAKRQIDEVAKRNNVTCIPAYCNDGGLTPIA